MDSTGHRRRPAPAWALAPLLGLLLAGCAGGGGGDGRGQGGVPVDGSPEGPLSVLPRPEWAVGDAWTYSFNGEETAYVVASETPTDWVMETDSAERAFADLREDISRLGPQRKSDLAGSQGDARVEFFRWPLTEGATWETTWDGLPLAIAVVGVDADRASGWADLTATDAEGRVVYRYSYSVESRWFTDLRRYDADGNEAVALLLQAAVHNWTGTLVRWEVAEVAAGSAEAGTQPLAAGGPFEVAEGTTDLWLAYHFTCTGTGGFSAAVAPANPGLAASQHLEESGPCVQVDREGPVVAGPHPGTWAYTLSAGGQTVAYEYALLARTRVDVPFPA